MLEYYQLSMKMTLSQLQKCVNWVSELIMIKMPSSSLVYSVPQISSSSRIPMESTVIKMMNPREYIRSKLILLQTNGYIMFAEKNQPAELVACNPNSK
jgi:hypothetical protein